jgi:hypothetical protein
MEKFVNEIDIARICHNVNKSYCESHGDFSQGGWDDIPEEIRQSAIDTVHNFFNHPFTAEESHDNWLKFNREHGWKYGEVKDLVNKIHPDLVPFDELPIEEQTKDKLFCAVCSSFLED